MSGDDRGDIVSLMADDSENLRGIERLAGKDYVLDERASAGAMKNFSEIGTHARSFSGGEDDDGGVGSGHERLLSLPMRALANERAGFSVISP